MTVSERISVNGVHVPTIMYGTAWKEARTHPLVVEALRAGFRAIDTANQRKHYHEALVGTALAEAYEQLDIRRSDIFLQTKFTHVAGQDSRLPYNPHEPIRTRVKQSLDSSLEHLDTEYVDSLVLHGPSTRFGLAEDDLAAWEAMEELQREGKVSLLGVSNVTVEQLELLFEKSSIKPSFVQNRCYAIEGWDMEVRRFCAEHGITYQGFSLLTANRAVLGDPRILELAVQYDVTPAQVIFRFALERHMIPLTGTTDTEHMREDLAVYDFDLAADEVEMIERLLTD